MRRFTSSWLSTIRKLGYRPARKRRMVQMARRSAIESLEQRLVFSTTWVPTALPPGNCTDECPCDCADVSATTGGSSMSTVEIGDLEFSYNSATQPHPVITFNHEIGAPEDISPFPYPHDIYVKLESYGSVEFEETYFAGPEDTDWFTFSFQADAGNLPSGRYMWFGEIEYFDAETDEQLGPGLVPEIDFFGFQDVINRDNSEFGSGWQLSELDSLVIDKPLENVTYGVDEDGVSLITGNNHAVWFKVDEVNSDPDYVYYIREAENPYSFGELIKDINANTYTLTNPDGTKSIFDIDGRLTSREDRFGNVVRSYTYASGLLESITDVAGNVTHFNYSSGYLTSVVEFYGTSAARTTNIEIQGGKVTKVTQPDPDGAGPLSSPTWNYEYHATGAATGLLKSVTNPRGLHSTVEYDDTRHVSQITERCDGVIDITSIPSQLIVDTSTTGYDPDHLATLTPANSSNSYDVEIAEHRVVFGKDQYITRNANSHITSVTDADGNVTNYTYHHSTSSTGAPLTYGLVHELSQPDPDADGPRGTLGSLKTTYIYNTGLDGLHNGLIETITHPDGVTETWQYDGEFGEVVDYSDSVGIHHTWYDVDSNGLVLSMTQVLGADDRSSLETDDLKTEYTYTDGLGDTPIKGLIETITDPNGNETLYTYYANGLVESVTYAESTADEFTEHFEYDDRDRLEFFHDGRGNITQYVYDNLDRLIQRIDPDPGVGYDSPVWNFRYDASGNQTHVIDPLGNDTEYVYDERGRVAQAIQHKGLALTPVALWKLDETAGEIAKDFTGSGHTAVVVGTADWAAGHEGNAFQFDGNTKLEAQSLMGDSDDVTIAGWANLTTTGNLGAEIVSLGDHFALRLDSGGYSGALYYDGSTWHTLYVHDTFAGEGWHFFAATFDDTNNELKLYIDGVLAATPLSTSDHIGYGVLGENTVIGRAGNGNTDFDFDGLIDNVGIYAGVLSPDQITALYQSDPPVAHWKLDEATGTTADNSAGSADGTVTGTTDWAPGRLDNGFTFDGDTIIQATGLIGTPANITVAAWAKLESTGSSGAEIVSLGDHFALRLDSSGTTSAFFYNGSSWEYVSISATFAGTGWHHFAATFDDAGNKFKLYIDGQLAKTETKTSSISYSGLGANTIIGRHGNGSSNYDFTGTIDDVRIYDYALTEEQIAELYSPDLVTQYDWDCNSNLTQTIDPMGHVTDYLYDDLNRLITRTDADPDSNGSLTRPVTGYTYNALGWLTSMTDPEDNVTFYQYDEMGRQTKVASVVEPGLHGEWYEDAGHDIDELLFTTNDPSLSFAADADFAGQEELPTGFSVVWTGAIYVDLGEDDVRTSDFFVESTDDVEFYLDDMTTPLIAFDGDGSMVESSPYEYDLAAGWHTVRIVFTDSEAFDSGLIVSYDIGDDQIVIDDAFFTTQSTTTKYDYAGRVEYVTDPLNRGTGFSYDETDRVTREAQVAFDPDNNTYDEVLNGPATDYTYDANGNVISVTNAEGDKTLFQYDALNRLTREAKVEGNGWIGKYGGTPLNPAHVRVDEEINFPLDDDFAGYNDLPDGFNATWEGKIFLNDSTPVTFYLNSTDDSDLYIDGQLEVDGGGGSGMYEYYETVSLSQGLHTVYVILYDEEEDLDDSGIIVSWDRGDGKEVIPGAAVFDVTEVTTYAYDDAGNLTSLTDGNDNVTTWEYDGLNRVGSESIEIDETTLTRSYKYDDNSNLIEKTDRNERVTDYEYDYLNRLTDEVWLDEELDPLHTIHYAYDAASNLTSVSDPSATYEYHYDALNRQTSVTQTIAGLTPTILLTHAYDGAGRMTSTSAAIGGTADYTNSYAYDAASRLTSLIQTDQSDNAVADKRIDLTYNPDNQIASILRYAGTTTSNPVASTAFEYDAVGRIDLIHHLGLATGSAFEQEHHYGYDTANRLTSYSDLIDDIMANYGYDPTGQLTSAADTGLVLPDEAYDYDSNGNREEVDNVDGAAQDYEVGPLNRIASDGTYTYEYDDEGNLISRDDGGGHRIYYTWDHRNRLVHVSEIFGDHETLIVDYVYDAFNQLVAKHTDKPFETGPSATVFVQDGGQVVLQFDAQFDPSPVDLVATDLSHRYLWGPGVDQLIADEQVTSLAATGEVLWAISDHQGNVTDVVDSNGDLRVHSVFDTFGNVVDEVHYDTSGDPVISSDPEFVTVAFVYTGRYFDEDTNLQNNHNRWFDATIGSWLSEDPIGFAAGDGNLTRYVGNSPTNFIDPSGLDPGMDWGHDPTGPGNFPVWPRPIGGEEHVDPWWDRFKRINPGYSDEQYDTMRGVVDSGCVGIVRIATGSYDTPDVTDAYGTLPAAQAAAKQKQKDCKPGEVAMVFGLQFWSNPGKDTPGPSTAFQPDPKTQKINMGGWQLPDGKGGCIVGRPGRPHFNFAIHLSGIDWLYANHHHSPENPMLVTVGPFPAPGSSFDRKAYCVVCAKPFYK